MKEFQHLGIVQQPLQIGRARLAAGDLNEFGVAVAARKLDKAQPIALVVEAQRLGVYRDAGAEVGGPRGGRPYAIGWSSRGVAS